MRFHQGCWVKRKGVELFSPKEVHFFDVKDNILGVCAPTIPIRSRGDVLEGINLTICFSSPAPEVLRVQTKHHLGVTHMGPDFELNLPKKSCLNIEEKEDKFILKSGSLSLEVTKNPFSLVYKRNNEIITKSINDLACVKEDWHGYYYDSDGDTKNTYMTQSLSLAVDELVYGLGERFTSFTKNGQNVEIWNEDGGTNTEFSYKNIPFYITNRGYGVLVNHPEKVSFEVASEFVTKVNFTVEGNELDYFLINGPSMKEVLMRYTDLTGKPALPAPWTFGLWLSTSFTTNYDEKTVMSFVDGMFERGIPLRVFHFDCYWMKEFHWSSFIWDDRVFPDPVGMLKRMKAKGLNICVWINPYIGQESPLFKEGVDGGFFVKRKNGDVWQWDMWQAGMALVDFTNPAACKWFKSKLAALLDMGVDCFKTDFGERIPTDVVYYDGSDANKMHNYYTYLYNKCVYELLEEKRGKGEAVLFARSATVGGQKFPVHWGGDCWSDYESMEESLRGGLSLLMSGFGFWSHDIGGFEATSTPDVYKRWAAFGLLSSHSRLHGSSSYRVPWAYDEEAVDVVRKFTKLKASLMPYLYKTAVDAHTLGIPTMRSMVMEFTEDRCTHHLDKQYMLGDSLLVAPIFNDESIGNFYLPAGKWTNLFTNETYEGGKWYSQKFDYLSIPLFVKENSIVVFGEHDDKPDYDYEVNPTVKIYEIKDGATIKTEIYNQKGKEAVKIEATRKGNVVTVSSSSKLKNVEIISSEKDLTLTIK
ncbi:MAG: alpha-xylosidase [Lachnospiraceae bacterium]|nr:alpha-xylosidase [Lachnospiraceae bacterium]